MKARAWLFLSGAGIVALQAANVAQIAAHHRGGAFLASSAISFVWWDNARRASSSSVTHARETYAVGAGVGTLIGMIAMEWLYR